jgi:hypothetical protein
LSSRIDLRERPIDIPALGLGSREANDPIVRDERTTP